MQFLLPLENSFSVQFSMTPDLWLLLYSNREAAYAVKSLTSFESNDDAKFRIAVSTLASRLLFFKNSDAVSVGNSLASEISSRVAIVVFQLPSLMFLSSGLRYLLFCFLNVHIIVFVILMN